MRTCETIIANFTQRVSDKEIIPPDEWMQAAAFLNVLIGQEQNKKFELEQAFIKLSLSFTEKGDSSAVADKKAKISPEWVSFKKQESFCKQIEEFIRIAKKNATISYEQGA